MAHLTGAGWLLRSQKVAQADGELAMCIEDGIGEYLHKIITPENAAHAHWYAGWIAKRSGLVQDTLIPYLEANPHLVHR